MGWRRVAWDNLGLVVLEDFSEEVAFQLTPTGSWGVGHVAVRGKSIPDKENSEHRS